MTQVSDGHVPQWRRLMPGLLGYRRTWLTADLLSGVTAAAYLVPQVMAAYRAWPGRQ